MPANYLIQLTEGDYTANYTIYYNSVDTSNIATLLGTNLPAEGISLDELLAGVSIDIPGTADMIIIVGDGFCDNSIEFQVVPTEIPPPPPSLCMTFITDGSLNSWQFEPNSSQNDKTKWEYTLNNKMYTIVWNPFVVPNRWEMKFIDTVIFVSTNDSFIPDSNWTIQGFTTQFDTITNLKVIQGTCPLVEPLETEIKLDPNICKNLSKCTGMLTVINTVGGTPPYSYSLDGSTPTTNIIFDAVCPGNHVLTTIDSSGVETTNTFSIGEGQIPVTYTLDIDYNNVVNVNSDSTYTETVEWVITPNPALTAGAQLTFNLLIDVTQTSSLPGAGYIQDINLVYFNNVEINTTSNTTSTITTPRTDGCSSFDKTIVSEKKIYTITMREGDTLSGSGKSVLYIPFGYGQSVNGCTTKLEQKFDVNVSNMKTQSQCSTVENPPRITILNNSFVPGYNIETSLCDEGYCKTNCCLYYGVPNINVGSDFVYAPCNSDFVGSSVLYVPTYFCHNGANENNIPITIGNGTYEIVGCCPNIPNPTVKFDFNLCSPNLTAKIDIEVETNYINYEVENSLPNLCSITQTLSGIAGAVFRMDFFSVENGEYGFYVEVYDGPILLYYKSIENGQDEQFRYNLDIGHDYTVRIYDKI
jgi:hypothetical protein